MAPEALPGSERPRVATSKHIGVLELAKYITVIILVRPRPGSPALCDFDWRTAPLSVQQYTNTYGSSEADLKAVTDFAIANGLHVLESHPGRRNVIVRGRVDRINKAFGIELQNYRSPVPIRTRLTARTEYKPRKTKRFPGTPIHRGFDGPVFVPEDLSSVITAVVGLDKRRIGASGGTGDPPNALPLAVPELAQLYNFPSTDAAGQTIGVLSGGGSYLSSDIRDHYFPSLPVGYQNAPKIVDVDLTFPGSPTAFANNPGRISRGKATDGDYELTQDICTASTIAQGATVNVYFTDDTERGWVAFLNRLLVPGSETQPSVVTSSWFFGASGDGPDTIGEASQKGTTANTLSNLFLSLTTQGISFFIAAGDWGCDDGLADGKCHVKYPASDPWVTCCGGTIIGALQPGSPAAFDERVWSDSYNDSSPFCIGNGAGATGGGVSDNFAVPDYQIAAGVEERSQNDNVVRRGVPDVAGMVGLTGFYMNGKPYSTSKINGVDYSQFTGTSCVAPLYCGLIALINSSLGRRIGFFNKIIYPLGTSVCNDVIIGNNDSGDTPPPPKQSAKPYVAREGWDACTGWGSLDGIKLLNGVVQSLFTQDMYFAVDNGIFRADEVNVKPYYSNAFWLVLEGFTPNVLGISRMKPSRVLKPTLSGPFLDLLGAPNISSGVPLLELPDNLYSPQKISFPFRIKFIPDVPFPQTGQVRYMLNASITVTGNPTTFTASTPFVLVANDEP